MTPNPFIAGPAVESEIYYTKHEYGHHKHYFKEELELLFKQYNYKIIYHSYHDNKIKNFFMHKVFFRVSNIDKKLSLNKFYRIFSIPFIMILNIFFNIIGFFIYKNEKHKSGAFDSLGQTIILKKIN